MKDHIASLVLQSLAQLGTELALPSDIAAKIRIDRTKDKAHGDFATNVALLLAKPLGQNPRALAEKIVAALPQDSAIAKTEIAGPGFINFFVNAGHTAAQLEAMLKDPRLGVAQVATPQNVVVDYSAPNVAKGRRAKALNGSL